MANSVQSLIALMGHRTYRVYTIGNVISLIGTWMHKVTVGWLTWQLTGSGSWLGLMAFADLAPAILVGPFAGAVADRWNIVKLLKVTQALGGLQAALLGVLYLSGVLGVEILFALTLLQGAVTAIAQPSRLALVSSLVPPDALGPAVAMNAVSFNLARFIGPAVAGILLASTGFASAFAANAASYVVFFVALHMLSGVRGEPARAKDGRRIFGQIGEGLVYVRDTPNVLPVFLIVTGMGLGARPVVELMPGYASGVLDGGVTGLAALTSAVGIGAIIGGIWMIGRARSPGLPRLTTFTAAGSALSVLLLAMAHSLVIAVPIAAVMGGCMVCTGVSTQVLLQMSVPHAMRGRILGLWGLMQRGVPALGALLVGLASDLIGLRAAMCLGTLLLLGIALRVMPRWFHIGMLGQPPEADSAR